MMGCFFGSRLAATLVGEMSQFDVAFGIDQIGLRRVRDLWAALEHERETPIPWTKRVTLLTCGVVVLLAVFAASMWTISGEVVPWDSKNHFYPMFRFLAARLANGHVPLWNPYHFGGYPSVADPQSLIFTPSMFLFAWLAPEASMQTFDAVIYAHLVAGALAVVALVRRRNWHPTAAVLAALIFIMGGPASSRLQHTGMIISYAYLPLAIWALEMTLGRRSVKAALLFGFSAALMALGRDQVAYLGCATLIWMLVAAALEESRPFFFLGRRLHLLVLAATLSLTIIFLPALLTIQFLNDSNRPGIAFGVAAAGSLNPVNFVTMLVPNIFGSLDWNYNYWGPGYETMVEPDWTDRAVNYLFIGSLPALLLFLHGICGARILGRAARPFLILAIMSGIYAVGRATPIFALAFDLIPGVELYRRPADATFILNFAFAMLSAYLAHRWVTEGLPAPFLRLPAWLALAFALIGIALSTILVVSAVTISVTLGHKNTPGWEITIATLMFALPAIAMVQIKTRISSRAFAASLLVLATGGELAWRNAASSLNAEPANKYIFGKMPAAQTAGLQALQKDIGLRHISGAMPRVEILGLGGAWQNASMVFGLENTLGYNPLRISEYERAVGPGENAVDPNARHFPDSFRGYRCNLATLLGLEYLVLDRPLTGLPRHVPRPMATALYAGDGMYVYKLGRAAPRAYIATSIQSVDEEEILQNHDVPSFDRTQVVLIDADNVSQLRGQYPQSSPESGPRQIRIVSYKDNRVIIDIDSGVAGILVLNDLYYAGWEAQIDDKVTSVFRANVLFRGVEVPAGHHLVTFEFKPFSTTNILSALNGLIRRPNS